MAPDEADLPSGTFSQARARFCKMAERYLSSAERRSMSRAENRLADAERSLSIVRQLELIGIRSGRRQTESSVSAQLSSGLKACLEQGRRLVEKGKRANRKEWQGNAGAPARQIWLRGRSALGLRSRGCSSNPFSAQPWCRHPALLAGLPSWPLGLSSTGPSG